MIHASSSFNVSSWENKILRNILCIPEDQLKFLNSLPEWSGLTTNGVNKQSDVNSHCSQIDSQILPTKPTESLQHLSFRSSGLLSNYQKYQGETFETSMIGTKKRHKSSSAIDIYKLKKISPCSTLLKRTLSASDIHLVAKQLEESSNSKETGILNKTNIVSNISQNSIKKNSFDILDKGSLKSLDANQNIPKGIKNKEVFTESKSSGEQMEVISEVPIANTCSGKKANEIEFTIMLEKQDISQHLKICTPTSENCQPNNKQINNINIETNNCKSRVLNIDDKTKEPKSDVLECDSGYNVNSKISDNSVSKNNEINLSSQKIIEQHSHTFTEVVDVNKRGIETFENEKHIVSDNSYKSNGSNVNENFHNVDIKETQKSCQPLGAISPSVETVSVVSAVCVKRKAEMKRNSKKHKSFQEKNKYTRNVKRAEKITYSLEEFKSMLEILQQFFV